MLYICEGFSSRITPKVFPLWQTVQCRGGEKNKNKQTTSRNATLNFRKISNSGNIIRNPSTLRAVKLTYFCITKRYKKRLLSTILSETDHFVSSKV